MPEILIIMLFSLIMLVVLTLGVTKIVNRSLEHRERIIEAKSRRDNASSEDYRKLEDRIRVLERIATDSNHALASQIEQLRDLQELDVISDRREIAR